MVNFREYERAIVLNAGFDIKEKKEDDYEVSSHGKVMTFRKNNLQIIYNGNREIYELPEIQIDLKDGVGLSLSRELLIEDEERDTYYSEDIYTFSIVKDGWKTCYGYMRMDDEDMCIDNHEIYTNEGKKTVIIKYNDTYLIVSNGQEKTMISIEDCSIERITNEIYKALLSLFSFEEWKENINELFKIIIPAIVLYVKGYKEKWHQTLIEKEQIYHGEVDDISKRINALEYIRSYLSAKTDAYQEGIECFEIMEKEETGNGKKHG